MNWLQSRRKQLGMSQEDLAARLQLEGEARVSRGMVSHWETDFSPLPVHRKEFTEALAKVLKTSPTDILRNVGYKMSPGNNISAQRAAEIVNQLDPMRQKIAVGLLEKLLET